MKLNYLTLSLAILMGFNSCSKDEDPMDTRTNANINGSVNLYDEATTLVDKSGMNVRVEGLTSTIEATTDTDGKFTLSAVPFGTYTLVYEKAGFGTYKLFELNHSRSGASTNITNVPSLGQTSSTQITDLTASVNGSDVNLTITSNPGGSNGNSRYMRYFLSNSSDVSDQNYTYYSDVFVSSINPKEISLSASALSAAGFSSGETVFVKAYGDSYWSNSYDDLDLERRVFPNLNPSSAAAVSFQMP